RRGRDRDRCRRLATARGHFSLSLNGRVGGPIRLSGRRSDRASVPSRSVDDTRAANGWRMLLAYTWFGRCASPGPVLLWWETSTGWRTAGLSRTESDPKSLRHSRQGFRGERLSVLRADIAANGQVEIPAIQAHRRRLYRRR